MRITNKFNLPDVVVRACRNDDYSRGPAHWSVTQIIDSPRIDTLRRKHYPDLSEDASEMIWALLGKGVHKAVEAGATIEHIAEERLYVEIDGAVISGACDLQSTIDGGWQLTDYKVTSILQVSKGVKEPWERQLNILRYLIEKNYPERNVTSLQNVVFLRDWYRGRAMADPEYPRTPILSFDVPLWTMEQTEQYLRDRVALFQAARADGAVGRDLPDCSSEEMWERETEFALRKKDSKRPVKVVRDFLAATEFIHENPDMVIDSRPGKRVRCQDNYCKVAEYCSQWKQYKADIGIK